MFNRRLGACLALVTLLVITGPAYAQTDRQPLWAQVEAPLAEDNPALITIAQAGTAEPPALQCKDPSSSMLWKVEGNDRDVYLFGSIHVGKADFYPLHDDIEQAFREAEHLVFEVDPQSASDTSVVLQMQSRGMLPAGQTLSDVVSGEVLQQLRVVLAELGMPEAGFMTMRPWFLTLVLSSFQMAMSGFEPRYGIENYLASRQTPDMEILELESIGEQISFLEELNAESFLAYTLEGFDEGQEEIESLISAWRCADKETLFNTLFSDFNEDPTAMADMANLREKLFYERNRNMAAGIQEFIDKGTGDYFVVVGSGHLLGDGSIIDLLRDKGHEVSPVRH